MIQVLVYTLDSKLPALWKTHLAKIFTSQPTGTKLRLKPRLQTGKATCC